MATVPTPAPNAAAPNAAAPSAAAPSAGRRPPLVRRRGDRVIAGVCAGLARHLGLPVRTVRIAAAVSCVMAGFGALLYLWLWALVPTEPDGAEPSGFPPAGPGAPGEPAATATGPGEPGEPGRPAPSGLAPSGLAPSGLAPSGLAPSGPAPSGAESPGARTGGIRTDALVGAGALLVGLYLLGVRLGWGLAPGIVVPVLVVGAGSVLAFTQLDEVERLSGVEPGSLRRRSAVFRLLGGALLVGLGITLLVVQSTQDVAQMGRTLVAAITVLGGTALVLAPWGVRMWRDLDHERASRAREAERAEIAAHLHDSVLQTLALIQRRSTDPAEVARLARGQERDLRAWLYGGPPADAASLEAAVTSVAADVEDLHGVAVDLVVVGDRPLDDSVVALVAALREAVTNAVRHGAAPVRVYVESGPQGVEAFVRDRGHGFELDAVPEHRRGLRDSVIGRMERHGGSARVRSDPEGTEVHLRLPPPAQSAADGPAAGPAEGPADGPADGPAEGGRP